MTEVTTQKVRTLLAIIMLTSLISRANPETANEILETIKASHKTIPFASVYTEMESIKSADRPIENFRSKVTFISDGTRFDLTREKQGDSESYSRTLQTMDNKFYTYTSDLLSNGAIVNRLAIAEKQDFAKAKPRRDISILMPLNNVLAQSDNVPFYDFIGTEVQPLVPSIQEDSVQGKRCLVIQSVGIYGTYKMWVCPELGYSVVRSYSIREKSQKFPALNLEVAGQIDPTDIGHKTEMIVDNVSIQLINNVPMVSAIDIKIKETGDDGATWLWTRSFQAQTLELNPDMGKYKAFDLQFIKDGTQVDYLDNPVKIPITWQGGKVKPLIDINSQEALDFKINDLTNATSHKAETDAKIALPASSENDSPTSKKPSADISSSTDDIGVKNRNFKFFQEIERHLPFYHQEIFLNEKGAKCKYIIDCVSIDVNKQFNDSEFALPKLNGYSFVDGRSKPPLVISASDINSNSIEQFIEER